MPVSDAQLEHARKSHGPHADRWVVVFANPAAAAAMQSKVGELPPGAIVAKEKRQKPDDTRPEGVAFMIKHRKGELAESGGWEFRYYPSDDPHPSYRRCIDCHRAGASTDYVFSTLGAAK